MAVICRRVREEIRWFRYRFVGKFLRVLWSDFNCFLTSVVSWVGIRPILLWETAGIRSNEIHDYLFFCSNFDHSQPGKKKGFAANPLPMNLITGDGKCAFFDWRLKGCWNFSLTVFSCVENVRICGCVSEWGCLIDFPCLSPTVVTVWVTA